MLPKINGLFRLTRDAELKYSASGNPVLSMGLASSEKYKDKETPCFIDAVVFSKPAEIINQYAGTKGIQIYLSGKLKTEQWDDKQTGQKRSKLVMTVEGFDFVSGQSNVQQQGQPAPMNQQAPQSNQHQQASGFQQPSQQVPAYHANDFDSEDVPFKWESKWPELFMLA